MTGPTGPAESPLVAYRRALATAGERDQSLWVLEARAAPETAASAFAQRFPARWKVLPLQEREVVDAARSHSEGKEAVFLDAPVSFLLEQAFPLLVRSLVHPRRNVTLVGLGTEAASTQARPVLPVRNDLATMRALPEMTVVAPADAPTTHGAVLALADHRGPAYLRVPPVTAQPLTDGTFAVGRAHEIRPGSDLTVVALGPLLAPALTLADELARVGVSTRVLDVASVKPFDEGAVLRAARDTGAILVLEAAPLADGVGTLVAALTAENYPVPVRRIGPADVPAERDAADGADDLAQSLERARDEAFELLRLRGKIT